MILVFEYFELRLVIKGNQIEFDNDASLVAFPAQKCHFAFRDMTDELDVGIWCLQWLEDTSTRYICARPFREDE